MKSDSVHSGGKLVSTHQVISECWLVQSTPYTPSGYIATHLFFLVSLIILKSKLKFFSGKHQRQRRIRNAIIVSRSTWFGSLLVVFSLQFSIILHWWVKRNPLFRHKYANERNTSENIDVMNADILRKNKLDFGFRFGVFAKSIYPKRFIFESVCKQGDLQFKHFYNKSVRNDAELGARNCHFQSTGRVKVRFPNCGVFAVSKTERVFCLQRNKVLI